MSRILKRPMFRKGGSTNSGIMTGLVDRKGYAKGPSWEEVMAKNPNIAEAYQSFGGIEAPRDTSLSEMLIGGGLNLVSGAGAGEGLMSNIAKSYKGPSEEFFKAQRAASDYDRKLKQAAVQSGLEQKWTLEQIKAKNNPQSALFNIYLDQAIKDGYDGPKAQRYATYQTTMKQELENKVGASRISDQIIDFNMQDTTTKANRNKIANLKKHVGKFVYDVFEGNIKLIQVVDGQVQYKTYNSVADIKADDLIPRTAEEEKIVSKYDTRNYGRVEKCLYLCGCKNNQRLT